MIWFLFIHHMDTFWMMNCWYITNNIFLLKWNYFILITSCLVCLSLMIIKPAPIVSVYSLRSRNNKIQQKFWIPCDRHVAIHSFIQNASELMMWECGRVIVISSLNIWGSCENGILVLLVGCSAWKECQG